MKKVLLLLLTLTLGACKPLSSESPKAITLSSEYYNNQEIREISEKEAYLSLIDEQKSFILYAYSLSCYGCSLFTPHIEDFVREENISIFKIQPSVIKETDLVQVFKFTPSVAIFSHGKFFVLLDPTSEKDADYFDSSAQFTTWIYTYIEPYSNA